MNKVIIATIVALLIIGGIIFTKKSDSSPLKITGTAEQTDKGLDFTGEKGTAIPIDNDQVKIATDDFETNKVKFFNTTLTNSKTVYFLVLKDKEGNFRAAANANQQCASFGKGYRQVGEEIECLTCNKKYPLSNFAIAQPDCNPYPINANLPQEGKKIVISLNELNQVAKLF